MVQPMTDSISSCLFCVCSRGTGAKCGSLFHEDPMLLVAACRQVVVCCAHHCLAHVVPTCRNCGANAEFVALWVCVCVRVHACLCVGVCVYMRVISFKCSTIILY